MVRALVVSCPKRSKTRIRKIRTESERRIANWTQGRSSGSAIGEPNQIAAKPECPTGLGLSWCTGSNLCDELTTYSMLHFLYDILGIWKGRMTRVCASLRSTIDEPRTTPLPIGGKVYRPTNIPRKGCVMQHFGISLTCRNLTYDFGRLPKARILQRARPIHVFGWFGWDAWVWIGVWLWSEVELIRHRLELSVDVQDIPARQRAIWASTIVR